MGRDFVGLLIDKNSNTVNDKSNGTIHVTPKAAPEKSGENDFELKDNNANARLPDNCNEQQDVLGVKSANHEPEEKIIEADAQKSLDQKSASKTKPASGCVVDGMTDADPLQPLTPSLEDDKQNSCVNHDNGAESNDSGIEVSAKSHDLHPPLLAKKSQTNHHLSSRKQPQPHCKYYYDEEDNWSMASSTATSVRMRVTVPVAPKFNCVNRLERRKEFYTKLDEKHKALEKEKIEYEARTKEEEQAAIKQLRKSMMYKANPVPSFYREGPPPKVELKKLPVTRAKSPNVTRRKSCGDATKSSPVDKGRSARHSIGAYREGKASPIQKKASPITPKSKENQTNVRKLSGSNKAKNAPKQSKEMNGDSQAVEQVNAGIAVES